MAAVIYSPGANAVKSTFGADSIASRKNAVGAVKDATGLFRGFSIPDGSLIATSEVSEYTTVTASGLVFTGPCEFAGIICSATSGASITIYDALSVTGTPFQAAETLVLGPRPAMGTGHPGKVRFKVGCYIVLSGAATVRVLVG